MPPKQIVGTAECPRCGAAVDLVEDEENWPGLATGDHCGLLIADWWEGTFVYELENPHAT